MRHAIVTCAVLAFSASLAQADVTITQNTSGQGLGKMIGSETVVQIKGPHMRSDVKMGEQTLTTIFDLDGQKMISLDHRKKQAEVYDLTKLSQDIEKAVQGTPTVKFTPNGQTKEINGRTTTGYDLSVSVPMTTGDAAMTIVMNGPVFIAKGAPGSEEFSQFYRRAAEKGLFFTDVRAARANPAQAKGMSEMYRALAGEGGIPYSTDLTMKFEGSGPMAGMMNRMGGGTISTQVTNVSTDTIPADRFEVPAGYSTKNR